MLRGNHILSYIDVLSDESLVSTRHRRCGHVVPVYHRLYIISAELSTLKIEKFLINHIDIAGYSKMGLFCYF